MRLLLAVVAAAVLLVPGRATAEPKLHECQHPVMTGVEVFGLKDISTATACPIALDLFAYESKPANARKLYGCHRPKPDAAGFPYLKAHSFEGYKLTLKSKNAPLRLAKDGGSFAVGGTDFPLNCT